MNQEIYDKMDEISQIALVNLYTLSKNGDTINLKNFDLRNKEHLFLIKIAAILETVCGKEITADCDFWQRLKLRKLLKKKVRKESLEKGVDVPEVLDFMRPHLKVLFPEGDIDFGTVYEVYFK